VLLLSIPGFHLWPRVPARLGFQLALGSLVVLLAGLISRHRRWLSEALREQRAVALASAALVGSKAVSILAAASWLPATLQAVRAAAVLIFFLLVLCEPRRDALAVVFARVAAVIILLYSAAYALGLALGPAATPLFQAETHLYLGGLPRFSGLSDGPAPCGFLMLVSAALVRRLPGGWGSALLALLGLALATASLSFPSLLVPVVIAWQVLPRLTLRWAATALIVFIAAVVLHFNVRGGLQPTNYGLLAIGALRCFVDHPLVGVGGRNFHLLCPVTVVTTLGYVSTSSGVHNEYVGGLAEHGLIGAAATGLFLLVMARRFRWQAAAEGGIHRVLGGTAVAATACGLSGEYWFQFPFAALVASCLGALEPTMPDRNSLEG
jgi:hypothetical protein